MLSSTLLVALSGLVSVYAQQSNYSLTGPISIVPDSVPIAERNEWCTAQMHTCPQICGAEGAYPNLCDANTLEWTCNCTSGIMPNISNYDQTIPSFVCAAWIGDCALANQYDQNANTGCHSLICGQLNASSGEPKTGAIGNVQPASTVVQSTSTAASTASSDSSSTTSAATTTAAGTAATTSASTSTGAAAAVYVANQYGTSILATGLLALFGLAL